MPREQPTNVELVEDGKEPEELLAASAWSAALDTAHRLALDYLSSLAAASVSQHVGPAEMEPRFSGSLPETGCTPEDAVREWFDRAGPGIVRSPGPRYFGFVTGGATPAALAGDWLAAVIDQNAGMWLASPAAAQTELTVIRWLLELFRLPTTWSGALTTGATMANLCGLAAARQWAAEQAGFDAARDGLGGQPPIPVISSVEIHQSARKALGILGLGRDALEMAPANDGSIDLAAVDRALARQDGPVIVIANAGEVNTGAFDAIRALADRCAAHAPGAWLHVDGAFGLYAALAPGHRHLIDGVELADSVATDAHKWLNVPYDCGIVFVRDDRYLRSAFGSTAAYLNTGTTPLWNAHDFVPEISRRFRALAVWCALRAAGASGYRDIVERSLANAQDFAAWVSAQDNLELLAPVHLNIVCFRVVAPEGDGDRADRLTAQATEAIQRGGVAYVTGTLWRGRVAIRAAFDNWATGRDDVAALKRAVATATTALA
jgi:glutamate/tyrosine decarboxylase-like PLP-dependent enzyme